MIKPHDHPKLPVVGRCGGVRAQVVQSIVARRRGERLAARIPGGISSTG